MASGPSKSPLRALILSASHSEHTQHHSRSPSISVSRSVSELPAKKYKAKIKHKDKPKSKTHAHLNQPALGGRCWNQSCSTFRSISHADGMEGAYGMAPWLSNFSLAALPHYMSPAYSPDWGDYPMPPHGTDQMVTLSGVSFSFAISSALDTPHRLPSRIQ